MPSGTSTGTSRSSPRTWSCEVACVVEHGPVKHLGIVAQGSGRQRVIESHDATGPQQPQRGGQVIRIVPHIGIAENHVVGAIGEPGKHVQRAAQDKAALVLREAGLGERFARHSLVFRLDINAGERPPDRIPRSSQMPELPQPVPISTAVLAPTAQARKRSVAPTAGCTGSVPPSSAA